MNTLFFVDGEKHLEVEEMLSMDDIGIFMESIRRHDKLTRVTWEYRRPEINNWDEFERRHNKKNKKGEIKMENFKIIRGNKVQDKSRQWWVEIEHENELKTWNFKRRDRLDRNGNPVFEIFPPYSDVKDGMFIAGIIGRRNNKRNYYMSNGYGMVQNIGNEITGIKLAKNTDLVRILEQFYN